MPKATQPAPVDLNPLLVKPKSVFLDALLYVHTCPL